MYRVAITKYLEKHGFEALRPKAVLFDMDGVLYDSMPHHAKAWQQSMAKFGIEMSEHDAYLTEGARGVDTIRQMVLRQQHREIDEAEAQRMYDEKTRCFHAMPETSVMPGVRELMGQIRQQGMLCCVVTGSGQRPLIERIMRDFGDYVDERQITTAYDVKNGKPAADPYLMGLHKAGDLKPWEGIVVENAPLGIRAGQAARCFTIGVNTGPLDNQALLDVGADLLFASMPLLSESWNEITRSL